MSQENHEQSEQSAHSAHGECRTLLKDLSDYIDGDLDEMLCQEIEHHMEECDTCRIVVDTLRKTVLLYHALPPEPIPDEVEARLFRRLDLSEYIGAQ
jgi:anti-sigma factor RsiW